MTMKQGSSDFLEYLGRDGHIRRATSRNTDVHNKGVPILQHTDDPRWYIEDITNKVDHSEFEWITYTNPDPSGNLSDWIVKVHCEFQPPPFLIKLTFGNVSHAPEGIPGHPIGGPESKSPEYIYTWFEHVRTDGNGRHPDKAMVFVGPDNRAWRAEIQNVLHWPAPPQLVLTPLAITLKEKLKQVA